MHHLLIKYRRTWPYWTNVTSAPTAVRPALSTQANNTQRSKIKSQDGLVRAGPTTDLWQSGSLLA
jgi:hypothetical protein